MSDYQRIAKAMAYIAEHLSAQPSLEEIAAYSGLSPYHFQRLFCRWAGTSPKRFQQVLTLERGKALLDDFHPVLDAAYSAGLSSSSRLHDHFVKLEAVTPGEYKSKGQGLKIKYGIHITPFGQFFVAVTRRGIHRAAFVDSDDVTEQLADLEKAWPLAELVRANNVARNTAEAVFSHTKKIEQPLSLHVVGTNFQIAVWKALLKIPQGRVVSYSHIGNVLGRPKSSRAVGNAIGANPVAFLIPCHRVIQQSGALGGYRWDPNRKLAIQLWENAQTEIDTNWPD